EVFLGFRIVRALDGEIDGFAVLFFTLCIDVLHVHHLLLVERRRPVEEEYVVTFLGGHLGRRAGADSRDADVVDGQFGVVFFTPFLDIFLVEPFVEGGHEVYPLKNLQALFGAGAVRPLRNNKGRAETGGQCPGSRCPNKIASSDLLASHDSLLSVRELWFPPGCYFARRNDTRQRTTNCPKHVPVFRNANCSWQNRDASNRHFESIYIRQANVMSILTEVDERGWTPLW